MANPQQRRFFILDETVPASEVPSMMCRVVADKLRPQSQFAPFPPVGGEDAEPAPHGTDAIIPGICPEPQCSHDHRESLWRSGAAELDGGGGALHARLGARTEARFELHARLLRRYALPNPERCFARLMHDARYAADVAALLRAARSGRAYLVTGFMTATDAVIRTSSGSSRTVGASAEPPSAALPAAGGAGLKHAVTVRAAAERERRVVGEEIFAVAYSAVRLERVFDAAAPRFHRVVPVIGPPKRSKARHLALAGGDDDSEEEVELSTEFDLDFYSDTETVRARLCSGFDDVQPSVGRKDLERVYLADDPIEESAAELSILWEPSGSGSF